MYTFFQFGVSEALACKTSGQCFFNTILDPHAGAWLKPGSQYTSRRLASKEAVSDVT